MKAAKMGTGDSLVKPLFDGPLDIVGDIHGEMRKQQPVRWWMDYNWTFCVFGHYSIPAGELRGNDSTFCVDYSVGKRWTERRAGKSSGFSLMLAAIRFPEKVIVFDEDPVES